MRIEIGVKMNHNTYYINLEEKLKFNKIVFLFVFEWFFILFYFIFSYLMNNWMKNKNGFGISN